jgi:hypothetical protein
MPCRYVARSGIEPTDSGKSSLELRQPIAWVHGDSSVDRFSDDGRNRHLTPACFGAQPAHLLLSQ